MKTILKQKKKKKKKKKKLKLAQSMKKFKKKIIEIIATKLFILIKISYILVFFIFEGHEIKDSKSLCFFAQPGIVNKKFK